MFFIWNIYSFKFFNQIQNWTFLSGVVKAPRTRAYHCAPALWMTSQDLPEVRGENIYPHESLVTWDMGSPFPGHLAPGESESEPRKCLHNS